MSFLDKMERKFGRFAIPGLMKYVIACYVIGYVIEYAFPNVLWYLGLNPYFIFHGGQVWRLISWVLIPPNTNILFAIIMLVLYYQLGTVLEQTWGTFRFNLFIFGGIFFTIIGALILYAVQPGLWIVGWIYFGMDYINMTIFLAFAVCYPDMRVMLYFLIPIKMKWMAIVYGALTVYEFITCSSWAGRVAIFAAILNFLIFFLTTRNMRAYSPKEMRRKRSFRQKASQPRSTTGYIHKCAICGRTEKDDPTLQFRFCSKCNGNYEYCQDHLFTHKHVL